ncbi:flagellar FlbD family protein [bacterium]|nr:flagellar FlbD family protein [bacterium]
MIEVTRLNGGKIVLNADLIEYVESTPDTIIALTSGKKYIVLEDVAAVVEKVKEYHRQVSPLFGRRPPRIQDDGTLEEA